MRKVVLSFALISLMSGSAVLSADPTTQPASAKPQAATPTPGEVELSATAAFNRGQYAIALPLLQKVAANVKDQPDKLGPVQEMIRVSQKAIATASLQQNAVAVQTDPNAAAATRTPHPAPVPGVVQEMAIKELGNFEYDDDKGGNIPADVKALSGSMIRLRGYMIPIDQAERISKFALVPSLFACCFGQPPQIQHTIVVDCPPGKSISYYPDEIIVEGKLTVEEKKDDDIITNIFELTTNSVKPAPK